MEFQDLQKLAMVIIIGELMRKILMNESSNLEESYCDSRPIGESWPICYLEEGHKKMHESFDYEWETDGPPILKKG